ncbi:hypothetical protein [Nocardia caishijiensis]|uniref:Uncharacterized protein n=1 Tax=Nocardia caishijiensis TaxID=184756 RepID=A0ABQ6YG07_9NOCA|nr:hypothetical protein [Nocardia caishijiensis]KAF0842556.1 hypothetical protein FNL39_111137 [Nocardia caishijiensis]
MAPNSAKFLFSNGTDDRVSLFDDGRVKVWSTTHLWSEMSRERHNALGETVLLGIGRTLDVPGPVDRRQTCDAEFALTPDLGHTVAATVAADNGTFVQFFHDGTIAVGNDGRDVATVFNAGREANSERGVNGVGGSVMVTFGGSYRPKTMRQSDFQVALSESTAPRPNRLYKDEFLVK